MPEALRLLPFLLVPVLALLFLNLRLSRKLRYPHDLLKAEDRRGVASFLFRGLRAYYDVLLDGLIALVLAFALFPPLFPPRFPQPAAVVVDGSRAMLAGFAENRPILKALKRMQSDPALKGAEPYLLTFDAKSSTTKLVPLASHLAATEPERAIQTLAETFDFSAPDYAVLTELRERGYGEITLLTDQLRIRPSGFKAIELGFAVDFAVYPSSVRFDRASEAWLVALAESGHRASMLVSRWDRGAGVFTKLLPDRYTVEEGTAGRLVRFSAPGLYLLSFRAPFGLDDIDLPLLLPSRTLDASAMGPFSERMLSIFPDVERSVRPALVLQDRGARGASGPARLTTALVSGPDSYVLDPATTGGALIATGAMDGVDLALGPAARQNEELVLAYESRLSARPRPFLHDPPPGTEETISVGTSHLARRGTELLPVIPPASQFFEQQPDRTLILPPAVIARWPWACLLALLIALKIGLWKKLTGKPLFARG